MAIQNSHRGVEVVQASERCTHYSGPEASLRRRLALLVDVHFPTPNLGETWVGCFKSWEADGRQFFLRKKYCTGAHQGAKDLTPDYWWLRVLRLSDDEEDEA